MKTGKIIAAGFVFAAMIIMTGCSVNYSFTGVQIPLQAQTFSVGYFQNDAPMVAPVLSNTLTEGIKDRLMRQTRLEQVNEGGDLSFEGRITGYATAPASVSADEYALLNRLTITIEVSFVNTYDTQWSFEQPREFSAFADYDANQLLQNVEAGLIEEIVEELVDKIFNASVTNW